MILKSAYIAWEEHVTVDPSQEHALRSNLLEYKARLRVGCMVLPDPFSLEEGWFDETGRENWPSLYFCDIADFLQMSTPKELYHRLCSEYKQGKAYRYFTSGWVKQIFYHPISDSSTVAFLAARVTPSMRLSSGTYQAWVATEKDTSNKPGGKIMAAYCTCTAGLKGSCNHVAGILFRVEYAVRGGLTKPSCTSLPCVWNAPSKHAASAPIRLCEQKWTKDQYFNQGRDDRQKSIQHLALKFTPLSEKQEEYVSSTEKIRHDLANVVRKEVPHSSFIQLFDKRPFSPKRKPPCPPSPKEVAQSLGQPCTIQDLKTAMKLSQQDLMNLQEATLEQSRSDEWVSQRIGRITASQFKSVFTRTNTLINDTKADPKPLIKSIMGYGLKKTTVAMKHGLSMEPHAKKAYVQIQALQHNKFHVQESGLVVSEENPILAASPDLLVACSCSKRECQGGPGLCEIKCPYSIKDKAPSHENWSHLVICDGKTTLSLSSPYYSQIQGQMALLGRSYCDLFVYTSHGHHLERIPFSKEHWADINPHLHYFWEKYIAPELIFGTIALEDTCTGGIAKEHSYSSMCLFPEAQTASLTDLHVPSCSHASKGPLTKPKIPLVYLCGVCMEDIPEEPTGDDEESVECSLCKVWYHNHCVQVKLTGALGKEEWLCPHCNPREII